MYMYKKIILNLTIPYCFCNLDSESHDQERDVRYRDPYITWIYIYLLAHILQGTSYKDTDSLYEMFP